MKNRNKRRLFLVLVSLIWSSIHAQVNLSDVTPDWFQAPAIIQQRSQEILVNKSGSFLVKIKLISTILKKDGSDLAVLAVGYSSAIKIRNISGNVLDLSGNIIYRSKKSDFEDFSNFSSYAGYNDNRVKILNLKQVNYPYIVEFEYEVEYPNLFYLPDWTPQPNPKIPVQLASTSYSYPKDNKLRFFIKNIADDAFTESEMPDGMIKKTWTLNNLPVFEPEPYVPLNYSGTKFLLASASTFDFDGYKGDLSTWESMGSWIHQLNMGKNNLSDKTKNEVADLIVGVDSEKEKVKLLYEYMQNKTRYVSIQLGIGGFMPFDAATVDSYGYGDCKALSNYMSAILEVANIKSNYALIYGGANNRQFFEEFPANYFNHAILAVPFEKDTVWLECTSQTNPFGYLSDFTSDRFALLITENGGMLAKTPKYGFEENVQIQEGRFIINESGNAEAFIQIRTKGLQIENGNMLSVARISSEEKAKWIQQYLNLPSLEVQKLEFTVHQNDIPEVNVETMLNVRNLANKSGNRLFLQPNQINVFTNSISTSNSTRTNYFQKNLGYRDFDTMVFKLPDGFEIENFPIGVKYTSALGEYETEFIIDGDELTYKRTLEMKDGIYAPELFDNYREFLSQIEKADKTKVVLKKIN
ncbi:protein of unknown function [Aquiflexum balticum DSM 16537]|uniref:DUF3857 domain-containing protein n=1 Tax=Aquiflexum balticum DSM 16537 TaxID=758820 RepID=A0A1W2H543_9BACT|nr:DUF3857 domain-containing transglutaminase family protein [Aquiflexum balticum]SMD44021.1 protein of unknown function [Aquiflexum balticum DSM 16537]